MRPESIKQMNWAWMYQTNVKGGEGKCSSCVQWVQFDCSECLLLEYGYKAYMHYKDGELRFVKIKSGRVDLVNNLLLKRNNPNEKVKVKRAIENQKVRPNGCGRHDPFKDMCYT